MAQFLSIPASHICPGSNQCPRGHLTPRAPVLGIREFSISALSKEPSKTQVYLHISRHLQKPVPKPKGLFNVTTKPESCREQSGSPAGIPNPWLPLCQEAAIECQQPWLLTPGTWAGKASIAWPSLSQQATAMLLDGRVSVTEEKCGLIAKTTAG